MVKVSSTSLSFNFVSKLAQIAKDNGAVNLSNDHSDFPCQPDLLNSLVWHLSEGRNKYAPGEGVIELRKVISNYYNAKFNYYYNPETEITITNGAIQGIFTALTSLIGEGDEVIIFEPAFETYVPSVEARGARPIYFQLNPLDFSIDWNALTKLISSKTKLIIINSPHNPTGNVFSRESFDNLQKIVNGTRIFLLSDEAFSELLLDGQTDTSVACYPKLAERSIIVGSLGKSLCVPGWKIGYCLAPEALMAEFRQVHRYQVYSANLPIQLALADYLTSKSNWFPYLKDFVYRRDLFRDLMRDSRFSLFPVDGGYFQVIGYENISQESDVDFSLRVAEEVGVSMLPLSLFYHDKVDNQKLRICFGKSEDELRLAAERLRSL
jgi:methionine aminotransferase